MRRGQIALWIGTVGGIGYLPWVPGTWGSLVGLLAGLLMHRWLDPLMAVGLFLVLCPLVASVCTHAERELGRHDAPPIVLDEVVGMAAIILLLPPGALTPIWGVAAFLSFRLFDIVKPPPLRRLARLPAGWGILADDLGASAYSCLLLWGIPMLTQSVVHSP